MKTTTKRVLAAFGTALLIVAMIVASGLTGIGSRTVKAEEGNGGSYSITVKNANPNQTYTLYKIFDATSNSARQESSDTDENSEPLANGISYTLPVDHSLNTEYTYTDSNNQSHTVRGSQWFHVDEGGNVIKANDGITTTQISTEEFKEWAKKFGQKVSDKSNLSEDDIRFTGLTDGYYFITTTTGSLVTVTSVAPNQIVKDKNGTPAVTKSEDESTNDVGKTVTYTVRINLVPGTKNVVFHDQLTNGLTLQGSAPSKLQVNGDDLATNSYTLTKWDNEATDGQDDIIITFAQNYLDSLKESTQVDLEYTAVVNSSAVVNAHNDAFLKYGENSNIESTHVKVYESTFGFQVNKVDDSNSPLTGAKFVLSRNGNLGNLTENLTDEQKAKLIKFDTSGRLTTDRDSGTYIQEGIGEHKNSFAFGGLDADKEGTTYYLYEVKAPDGYNKLTGPVEVKITPTFDTAETTKVNSFKVSYKLPGQKEFTDVGETGNEVIHQFDIANNQGILLPSTGGIGTIIFYIVGAAIVVAAVTLIVKRRKDQQKDA